LSIVRFYWFGSNCPGICLIEQQIGVDGVRPVGTVGDLLQVVCVAPQRAHHRYHLIVIMEGSILGILWGCVQGSVQRFNAVIQSIGVIGQLTNQCGFCPAGSPQGLLCGDRIAQIPGVVDSSRENLVRGHIHHGSGFNVDYLVISLQVNGVPCAEFRLGKNAMAGNQLNILVGDVVR